MRMSNFFDVDAGEMCPKDLDLYMNALEAGIISWVKDFPMVLLWEVVTKCLLIISVFRKFFALVYISSCDSPFSGL